MKPPMAGPAALCAEVAEERNLVPPDVAQCNTTSGEMVRSAALRPRRASAASPARIEVVAPIESGQTSMSLNRRSLYGRILDRSPPWLTSLVVHGALIVILGLLVLKSPLSDGRLALNIELGGGSESRGNGSLEDSFAAAADIAASETAIAHSAPMPESVALSDLAMPKIELAESSIRPIPEKSLLASGGAGLEIGEGSGTGAGEGEGNSGAGSGNGTAPTRTQVFGLVEEARSFVYVFDRSDSMNSVLSYSSEGSVVFSITPLEAAKAELLRSLEDLDHKQRFQIVFYNHASWLFGQDSQSRHLLIGNRENKLRAKSFVTSTYGEGGTYHVQPLEIALSLRPDAIFLLTDGEAKDDPTPLELSRLRAANRGRTKINVIHFCFVPRPDSTLVQLAKDHRGQHLSFNLSRLGPGIHGNDNNPADPRKGNAPQRPATTSNADPGEPEKMKP